MAALKAILKSLEGLADPIKELYRKDGEEFRLDVEGLVPKATLDEFRDNNVLLKKEKDDLTAKLKQFDGIDVAKVKEMQETERKVKDGELVKAGKYEELLASKIDPILKRHSEEREADKKDKERLATQLSKVMIDQELTKIATAKGLRPEAIMDMLGRLRPEFSVVGDKVVSLDEQGGMRRTDSGEPYSLDRSIEGLAKAAPHLFQPSTGGGTPPGGPKFAPGTKTMVRAEFDKLDPTTKMTFVTKDGGKVTDV